MGTQELKKLIGPLFSDDTLTQIVRKKTGWQHVSIKNIIIDNSESKKGDSYLSTVIRFKVEATGRAQGDAPESPVTIALITKTIPKNVARRKTFRSTDFFSNEINFYELVWETFRNFLKEKNLSKLDDILPLCLASESDGENDFIVLEDASFSDYQGIARGEGLDYEHSVKILKCFAQFHAISYAYKDQHPDNYKNITSSLSETYFHEKFRSWYTPFQKNLIATVRDCVEKQLPESYLKAFDKVTQGTDFFRKVCNVCAEDTPLTVVTHGDAWVPNFLMKYDSSKTPVKPMMIDFQLARCASLALDLTFFMYTCVQNEIRSKHFEDLIHIYLQTFQELLNDLGSDSTKVTFQKIMSEIKGCGYFAVAMSMEGIVMSLLDDDSVADIDAIQGSEAVPLENIWILHPFKSVSKQQRIADIIRHAVDNEFI